MLLHSIGAETFKKGIKQYLIERSFDTSNPDLLSEAMQDALDTSQKYHPDLTFKKILDSWHKQTGYPILMIEFDRVQGDITISQKRFLTTQDSVNTTPTDKSLWWIPYNFITSIDDPKTKDFRSTEPYGWLGGEITIVTTNEKLDLISAKWVLFNKQQTGYYRVNYDESNWKELIKALKAKNASFIPTLSRSQLIDDAFIFAKNGLLGYPILLSLLQYLPMTEDNHIPWFTFFDHIHELKDLLIGSDTYFKYEVSIEMKKNI